MYFDRPRLGDPEEGMILNSTHAKNLTMLPERNLDVLRAIAVLSVVSDHGLSASPLAHSLPFNPWILGRLGVLLFFVHTSLVLMSSLERQGDRPDWVRAFYVRRALRIYPLAIVCISIVVALGIPSGVGAHGLTLVPAKATLSTALSNLLLIQNLTGANNVMGVLWSLPLEIQMYLLLPFCFLIARSRAWGTAGLILLLMASGYTVNPGQIPGIWRLSVFIFGPCFAGGVLAYHLIHHGTTPHIPSFWWIPAIALVALGFAILKPDAEHPMTGWLPCLTLGLLIPQVRELGVSRLTRSAHWIAKYSYGIYLVHVPLLWVWLVPLRNLPSILRWIGWLASTALFSVAFFRLIESPMIRFGSFLVRRPVHAESSHPTTIAPIAP